MSVVLKKTAVRVGVCLAAWLIVDAFAAEPAYSGFWAGLMGACWLLAAWVKYLKSKGTDLFRGLRRQQTEVPYYLRSEKNKKPRLSLNGNRHLFNDDLADSPELPEPRRLKLDALSCLIAAVVLLAWSQFG